MVVLMYHAFGPPGEAPSRFVIPAHRFTRQMALLKWAGYDVLSLEDYLHIRLTGREPRRRSVVITIDDGYADNRSVALPILRRYGFPATIFLVVDKAGGVNDWADDLSLRGRRLMSWDDVSELRQSGIQFGAHTRTHARLGTLPPDVVRREVVGSQLALSRVIGAPVRLFSYPYGDCNATVQSIVAQAGFLASCGTQSGINTLETPVHDLRRTEIRGTDTLLSFALKLRSGHDGAFGRRRLHEAPVCRSAATVKATRALRRLTRSLGPMSRARTRE
jgi:peptidoglycan/xylan/chitin deacetylase (PgdA/CDA1 family)